jgi:hypothetical protein
MAEDQNGSGGAPNADDSVDGKESAKGSVAYDTYRKTVGEVKSLKSQLAEYKAKEAELEQAKLTEQGKYKEALDAAQKKAKELEDKLQNSTKLFTKNLFTKEAKAVAMQMGAVDSALDDIVKVGDWSSVEIDENMQVNSEQLKEAMAKLAKEKSFFFKKTPTSPKDVNPNGGAPGISKKLEDLSTEELIKLIKA